ncbi:thrombospondin type 3 repeat-containing protein [Patescibacteria group bacterium]|nr:thrombospondin type 3 repeat-containing protein [Patescibacteria group bacterium]
METRKSWGTVVWAVVFAVVAVGVSLGTYLFENGGGAKTTLQAGGAGGPADADGDGLQTWEEVVWKTDPTKKDSDGDGVSDGAEIFQGTDPAVSNEGTLGTATPSQTTSFVGSVAAAESYIAQNKLTPEEQESVRMAAIQTSVSLPKVSGQVPYSALTVVESRSLSAYAQSVVATLKFATLVRENELTLFKKAMEENNYSGTTQLKNVAILYKKIAAALLAIEVPRSLAVEHLALINAIDGLANTVNLMAGWQGDPVQSLTYMDTFIREQARVEDATNSLFAKISNLL